MARPKLNKKDLRTLTITVPLSRAEKAKIVAAAKQTGMAPATWLRAIAAKATS